MEATTPSLAFDPEGSLVRFSRDPARHVILRDVLVAAPAGARWQRQGESEPMAQNLYENIRADNGYVATPSGRHVLMFANGVPTVFDRLTGEKRADPWLESALTQVRARADNVVATASSVPKGSEWIQDEVQTTNNLRNLSLFLSEDLAHLIVWARQKGADVVVYSRDEKAPVVVSSPLSQPFSIEGRLFLFAKEPLKLRLVSIDGSQEFHVGNTRPSLWPEESYFSSQHRSEGSAITLFVETLFDSEAGVRSGDRFTLVTWFYRQNKVSTEEVRLPELFRRWNGQFYPKAALPVK
ncbi:MAG TPA: hypothetical protein VHO24_05130 [Opitutaceae bacterium]|nr:hypothetical protein [Opitutaceae bacterium]